MGARWQRCSGCGKQVWVDDASAAATSLCQGCAQRPPPISDIAVALQSTPTMPPAGPTGRPDRSSHTAPTGNPDPRWLWVVGAVGALCVVMLLFLLPLLMG